MMIDEDFWSSVIYYVLEKNKIFIRCFIIIVSFWEVICSISTFT